MSSNAMKFKKTLKRTDYCNINKNVSDALTFMQSNEGIILELSRIGGVDCADIVKRLMYKIFINEVGMLYSWDGAKKKNPFKNLKIASVIFDAVRANKVSKICTECEIITCIKKWLLQCKDRIDLANKKRQNNVDGNATGIEQE